MNKSKIFKIDSIFPILVLVLSLLNLSKQINSFHFLSAIISLIGIIGCILYYFKIEFYRTLIYLWIIAQVIVIERMTLNQLTNEWYDNPILDLTQTFCFNLGFYSESDTCKIGFKVNLLAILFLGFLRVLESASLIGSRVQFEKYRDDNHLGDIFPLYGIITDRIKLTSEKNWLLVKLDTSFEYENKIIYYVIIKTRDGVLQKNNKNDLVYFRLVVNEIDLNSEILDYKINPINGKNDINDFPFIDWALCKVI